MLRGDDAEYQRRYHTLGNTRRLSNPDMEAFAKLHKSGDMEHQRNKYPPQHAATLVNTNCARQQVCVDLLSLGDRMGNAGLNQDLFCPDFTELV